MKLTYFCVELRALNLDISDDLLVHLALLSLPAQFNHFAMSYNLQREKWSVNELITHLVTEEARLRDKKGSGSASAYYASTSAGKKRKATQFVASTSKQKVTKAGVPKAADPKRCHFCKKVGHFKKDCQKYQNWKVKKGLSDVKITE